MSRSIWVTGYPRATTGRAESQILPNPRPAASPSWSTLVSFSTLKLISDDVVSRFRRLWGKVGEWRIPFEQEGTEVTERMLLRFLCFLLLKYRFQSPHGSGHATKLGVSLEKAIASEL